MPIYSVTLTYAVNYVKNEKNYAIKSDLQVDIINGYQNSL